MPFSLTGDPSPTDISDAINYLLNNFGSNVSIDVNTGIVAGPSGGIGYLYKYLDIKYATSFDGSVGFSNSPTGATYYGSRNNNSSVESTNPADYIWTQVTDGFGTTKFIWYSTNGGRQINTVVSVGSPGLSYLVDPGTAIDLDVITGTNALMAALPAIYKWTTGSAPSRPSTTSTYTWALNSFSPPSGWSSLIPSDTTPGDTLWAIYIPLSVLANTVTSTLDWTNTGYPIVQVSQNGVSANKYATAYLYQWSTTTPSNPSGSSTYTWATGASSSYTGGGGWSTTVPTNSGVSGLQLWVASKQVTDISTATSTSVSWASGFSTYVAGQNGTAVNGVQTARPTVYQWALSTPSISGTSTYTWATGSYTAPSGWATTITTSPSAGYTLYAATVPLTDSATATTTTISWTTASIVTAGFAGTNGASSRITYARVPSNPTPVSGNITTSGSSSFPTSSQSTTTWGFAATWGASDPNPSSTNTLYQADGIYDPTTTNTVWSTPYISSLKVGSLSAVSTNTGSLTVSGTLQANTAAISGSTLTGSGAVIYSSGVFGIGSSSNNIVYDGSNLNINGGSNINITGNALFDGAYSTSRSTYAVVANASYNANGGVIGYANESFQSAIYGQASELSYGGLFETTGSSPALIGYSSGTGDGLSVAAGTMSVGNNTLVANLYSQYTYYLKGQGSGASNLYFQTGPTTGASVASFTATNKPGTTSGSNTWIEVIIGGVSYQIPVWAS